MKRISSSITTALLGGALYLALGLVAADSASAQSCIEGPIGPATSSIFFSPTCPFFSANAQVSVSQPSLPGGFRRAQVARLCGSNATFNIRLTTNRVNTDTGSVFTIRSSKATTSCFNTPLVQTVSGSVHIISAQCTITTGTCPP